MASSDPSVVPPPGREQLRKLVVAALTAAAVAPTIDSPGDWEVPPSKLPAILVRAGAERKASNGRVGDTQFTTDLTIVLQATVQGVTAAAAQAALDLLGARIEDVLLRSTAIRSVVQDFPVIETVPQYRGDGRTHFATLDITVHFEIFEAFDPDVSNTLKRLVITVDTREPFDASGTYPDPPFADAIAPAPRTSGPDGRAEGVIDVSFPDQE